MSETSEAISAESDLQPGSESEPASPEIQQLNQEFQSFEAELKQRARDEGYGDNVKGYLDDIAEDNSDSWKLLQNKYSDLEKRKYRITQAQERKKLFEAVPELKSEKNRAALQDWLIHHRGYSEEQIAATLDHRVMADAWNAYQHERLKELRTGRKVTLPKKPHSNQSHVDRLQARLAETGSIDDAYELLTAKRRAGK